MKFTYSAAYAAIAGISSSVRSSHCRRWPEAPRHLCNLTAFAADHASGSILPRTADDAMRQASSQGCSWTAMLAHGRHVMLSGRAWRCRASQQHGAAAQRRRAHGHQTDVPSALHTAPAADSSCHLATWRQSSLHSLPATSRQRCGAVVHLSRQRSSVRSVTVRVAGAAQVAEEPATAPTTDVRYPIAHDGSLQQNPMRSCHLPAIVLVIDRGSAKTTVAASSGLCMQCCTAICASCVTDGLLPAQVRRCST